MEISNSFEKHLPDQLYTVLEERELLDGEEHAFETEKLKGSLKLGKEHDLEEKEVVQIKISFTQEPNGIQALYDVYQEKLWFVSAIIDAQGRPFEMGSIKCCPLNGLTKEQLEKETPQHVQDTNRIIKILFDETVLDQTGTEA